MNRVAYMAVGITSESTYQHVRACLSLDSTPVSLAIWPALETLYQQ